MGSGEGQTYCLRWNNHKPNLVEILSKLFEKKSYVDCTLHVDDRKFFVHRVVLAANSTYFQSILQDVPMDHCTILFPGVQGFEMQALLDYMYTGEANVTQSVIPRIMQIAEQLEVKGLFEHDLKDQFGKIKTDEPPYPVGLNSLPPPHINNNKLSNNQQSSPIISQSAKISSSVVQSSTGSPPYSYKSNYANMFGSSSTECPPPQWPMATLTAPVPCGKLMQPFIFLATKKPIFFYEFIIIIMLLYININHACFRLHLFQQPVRDFKMLFLPHWDQPMTQYQT